MTLARRAGPHVSWSTFHAPSISLRQPPFDTRARNYYNFCVQRGNMQAIIMGNRRCSSRHVAKPCILMTFEDLKRLQLLIIIKSSYLFKNLNLRGQDLIFQDLTFCAPLPSFI